MSNAETIQVRNREWDHRGPPLMISNTEYRSDPALDKNGADENTGNTERTLTPRVPSLSPLESGQGSHGSLLVTIWQWTLVFFVPVISIAYLTFCYVVHYRIVPARVVGFSADATSQFLTNFGSAITTINIIVISLALFPLKGLICDLQSEEFFRLLSTQKNSDGVKLDSINGISNSSYGLLGSVMVIMSRHCSLYYFMALAGALLVWAVTTLAPPALGIQPIIVDGPIMAFSVGAIPPLSLYQPVAGGQVVLPSSFSPKPGYSAAVVWAEREIGLSYSFSVLDDSQGVYSGFAVPTPLMLNSTLSARWLTDVVAFNPYCIWPKPVNLSATSLNVTLNSTTDTPVTAVTVHLEGADLQVSVPSSYFPTYQTFAVSSINAHDPTATVFNYTTGSLPTDGATVMSVIQCTSTNCTEKAIDINALFINFTDVPSMGFSAVGADYTIGFLVCKPNITIETREIRTRGSMTLEVQPLAEGTSPLPRQGNLDWTQTSLLASYSLSALTTDSGPSSSAWNGIGSATQADFIFGSGQMNSIQTGVNSEGNQTVLTPLSTGQLAEGYTEMLKASMKPYVSGALGTSYVPGRVASVQQIFVSSMPHVVASTVLIALLLVMAVVAQFRRGKGDQFNLTNVAAALAESELPQMAKRVKVYVAANGDQQSGIRSRWLEADVGQEVAEKLGNWKVSLRPPAKADEVETLHVSRD